MRILAIDLGARRVGLALSDAGGQYATPLRVLNVASADQAIQLVLAVIDGEGVERVVIGLPINMDDSLGPAARQAQAWGKKLEGESHLPVIFVDERLSSFAAEQGLIARKRLGERLTRKRKKEQLDALAAASFLQAYLDGKLKPIG